MAYRTFDEIVAAAIAYILQVKPTVDTKEGTVIRDVVIESPADEFSYFYELCDEISDGQSPDNAAEAYLLSLAENFGLTRGGSSSATGIITFYRTSDFATDVTIPKDTIVTTQSSPAVSFRTTGAVTMYAAQSASYYNTERSRYEITAPIESLIGGESGNVSAGTITSMTPVEGIVGCNNYATTTGGAEQESITSLRARLKSVLLGNNIGTKFGYQLLMLSQTSVSACLVVTSDDDEMRRAVAGAVDIYIKGSSLSYKEDNFTYYDEDTIHILDHQPVDTSTAIYVVAYNDGLLVEDTDYEIQKDTGELRGSERSITKIVFLQPLAGGQQSIIVSYYQNSLIPSLQALVEADSNHAVGSDILVKWGRQRKINVTAKISLTGDVGASAATSNVQEAISDALNTYTLGGDVQQSDIVAIAAAVEGVDDIIVPFDVFEEDSSTADSEADRITKDENNNLSVPATSYAIAGTITISTY